LHEPARKLVALGGGQMSIVHYRSLFSFRFPQCGSLRSGLNTRSIIETSSIPFRPDQPKFLRRQGPIDRALGFGNRLLFSRGLAPHDNISYRNAPLPQLPLDP
jgi:hypothetical protein